MRDNGIKAAIMQVHLSNLEPAIQQRQRSMFYSRVTRFQAIGHHYMKYHGRLESPLGSLNYGGYILLHDRLDVLGTLARVLRGSPQPQPCTKTPHFPSTCIVIE